MEEFCLESEGDRPWLDLRDLSVVVNNPSDTLAFTTIEQPEAIAPLQETTGMAIALNGTFQLVTSNAQNANIPHASCTAQVDIL